MDEGRYPRSEGPGRGRHRRDGGIGFEVARELARTAAHVVMACRDVERADSARRAISDEILGASLEVQEIDLASLETGHAAAARIRANRPRIDVLVDNAGARGIPERQTTATGVALF